MDEKVQLSSAYGEMNHDVHKGAVAIAGAGNTAVARVTEELKKEIESKAKPMIEAAFPSPTSVDIEGVDELIATIPSLNFIEISRLKRNIDNETDNLKSAMSLINSFESMNIDDIAAKTAAENVLQDREFKEDSAKFKESYQPNLDKLNRIQAAIEEEPKNYDDVVKGTKFLNDEMIDILNKNIAKFAGKEEQFKRQFKILNITLDCYKNRASLEYFLKKAQLTYIIDGLKREFKNDFDKVSKLAKKEFLMYFDQKQLDTFESYVFNVFDADETASSIFIYHLAKILRAEKDTGYYNHVKTLVMNVCDIVAELYDLDGGTEAFDAQLRNLYPYYK